MGSTARTQTTAGMVVFVLLAVVPTAWTQTPAEVFEQSCAACHSIGGGPLVGPDLKGITERKDRQWLTRFIEDPQAVLDSGDAYAKQIVDAAHGMVMPPSTGISHEMIESLLDYIHAQSTGAAAAPAGPAITDRPFTADDVARGRALFVGTVRLENGGASCMACHHAGNVGALGGGALGPDLSDVFTRLQGRNGLGRWLSSPATPVMQQLFASHKLTTGEIESLLAFFEDTSREAAPARASVSAIFVAAGLGGAVLALAICTWLWRGRFRGVRRRLVGAVAGSTR